MRAIIKGLISAIRNRNRTRAVDLLFRSVFSRLTALGEDNLALAVELLWRFRARGLADRARNALEAEYLATVKEELLPALAVTPSDPEPRRKVS